VRPRELPPNHTLNSVDEMAPHATLAAGFSCMAWKATRPFDKRGGHAAGVNDRSVYGSTILLASLPFSLSNAALFLSDL